MGSNSLDDSAESRRFISVGIRVAGIVLLALLVSRFIAMTVFHVPFLPPEDSLFIRETFASFVRLAGVSLAVVYGVTALR